MAKNRVFNRRYVIEFKGITTNEFMPAFLDRTFDSLVKWLAGRFKQLRITKYTTEDLRTGGASELTPGGVQINLLYKSPTTRRAEYVKPTAVQGSEKGKGRQERRPLKSQQLQT